jgi:hypothetical protein
MIEKAKFRYSAHEGVLELEGSEEFVTKHFTSLTDIVRIISRHISIETKPELLPISATGNQEATSIQETSNNSLNKEPHAESLADYPCTFSEINGKLKIVSEIPGNSIKSKMTNAAILYCYGSMLLGDDQVSSKEIRETCEEHGCLDSANFSKVFSEKTIFLSDGVKGGNKDIKLSFPGKQKAKELLKVD